MTFLRKVASVKNYILFGLAFAFFLASGLVLYFLGPGKIIQVLGPTNSYLVGFLMGIFGGSSFFFAVALYAVIFIIVKAGLNPYILGAAAGIGLTIGDSLFYWLGLKGRKITHGWLEEKIDIFGNWLKTQSIIIVMVAVFVYIAFTPLPNGLLMASTGLARYRYRIISLSALVGNVFFLTFIGVIAKNSINYLFILLPTIFVLFVLLVIGLIHRSYKKNRIVN